MGRSKSTPLQKVPSEEKEVFGRREVGDSTFRALFAGEPVGTDKSCMPSHDKTTPLRTVHATPSQTQNPKAKKRSKKQVSFKPENQGFISSIEVPEISIEVVEDSQSGRNVFIFYRFQQDDSNRSGNSSIFTKALKLPEATVQTDKDLGVDKPLCLPVRTSLGAFDLWKAFQLPLLGKSPKIFQEILDSNLIILFLRRSDTNNWCLDVSLTEKALDCCRPEVLPIRRPANARRYSAANSIHSVLAALFPDTIIHDTLPNVVSTIDFSPISARQIYALTDNKQLITHLERESVPDDLVIPDLKPKLRPYQAEAVKWMLERERSKAEGEEWKLAWVGLRPFGDPLPLSQVAEDDRHGNIFFSPFVGWITRTYSAAKSMMADNMPQPRGGILAESMGLGKTVEVLSCILANRRPTVASLPVPFARRNLDSEFSRSRDVAECHDDLSEQNRSTEVRDVEYRKERRSETYFNKGDTVTSRNPHLESFAGISCLSIAATNTRLVTPEPKRNDLPVATEQWLQDDYIGSCICGKLISLPDLKKELIIICCSCKEPMHEFCASFDSTDALMKASTPYTFRRSPSGPGSHCRLSMDEACCPCCFLRNGQMTISRATLIVTPSAILRQWEQEIQKHTVQLEGRSTKCIVYNGVEATCKMKHWKKECFSDAIQLIHPARLADADIVLITFDTLMSDLNHSDDNRFLAGIRSEQGNLRRRKRYRVVPSPLTKIRWWRICLDEAQRVETPTAKSAIMALKLETDHRWCVSGTPIGRGRVEDLYGLLLFLRMLPFQDIALFLKCFSLAHRGIEERIQQLLCKVFWRSTSELDSVRRQMGVPEQVEEKVLLRFSSIEKHFYERQLEQTITLVGEITERESEGKRSNSNRLTTLADRLHKLRAACCHPQVGSSGIGRGHASRLLGKRREGSMSSLNSRVMTMDQILERFIEEAKLKCEESQRLAVMHTNAMAALSTLKIEAKKFFGVNVEEEDEILMKKSCDLYQESLMQTEKNAAPTLVIGEAVVTGMKGFQSPYSIVGNGKLRLEWKFSKNANTSIWAQIDFQCAKKLTEIRLRPLRESSTLDVLVDGQQRSLCPRDCTIQVPYQGAGDEWIDVSRIFLSEYAGLNDWSFATGFHTKKSKTWRICLSGCFPPSEKEVHGRQATSSLESEFCVGLECELFEATIAQDPLQRLHSLNNGALCLERYAGISQEGSAVIDREALTEQVLCSRAKRMKDEACQIESLYLASARATHDSCKNHFQNISSKRLYHDEALGKLSQQGTHLSQSGGDCWDEKWWDEFLVLCCLYGNEGEQRQIVERILQDLEGYTSRGFSAAVDTQNGFIPFPDFNDIAGLRTAMDLRIQGIRVGLKGKPPRTSKSGSRGFKMREATNNLVVQETRKLTQFRCQPGMHSKTMATVLSLSPFPQKDEIVENSCCRVCKADWKQTGPECRHCKIGDVLDELEVDKVTLLVLRSVYAQIKSMLESKFLRDVGTHIEERAKEFFSVLEWQKREKLAASSLWRVHLDLLNDLDELNQCKRPMRLLQAGEDPTKFSDDELNAIVFPVDACPRYHDSAAKQAMALGDLRRAHQSLRYLKNQWHSRKYSAEGDEETCVVCLSELTGERAVLRCGHSFHYTPCLEKLRTISGEIKCPLRCTVRTSREDVMVAVEKSSSNGSETRRVVKGSWGTKVTRLVADIMDVQDKGEKSIVFSQWEDMIDICQQALEDNAVGYTRARSLKDLSGSVRDLQSVGCDVLLLNVKKAAEGLTILEASHVFLVEPLLNHSLDSQALARINRIGQTRKTYVHRYIMEDTIEVKIDSFRLKNEGSVLLANNDSRKPSISAGGADGGFHSRDELMNILNS